MGLCFINGRTLKFLFVSLCTDCAIARDKLAGKNDAHMPDCCPNGNYPKVWRTNNSTLFILEKSRERAREKENKMLISCFELFVVSLFFFFFLYLDAFLLKMDCWLPKVDCRRSYCFCVDANGNQIEREVSRDEISTLSCYNKGVWC